MIKGAKTVKKFPGKDWVPLTELAKELGINYKTLYMRARLGLVEVVNWNGITLIKREDFNGKGKKGQGNSQ